MWKPCSLPGFRPLIWPVTWTLPSTTLKVTLPLVSLPWVGASSALAVASAAGAAAGAGVAAGSVVLSNTKIPPYTLWAGVPAKYVKDVEPHQTNEMNRKIAHNYAMYSGWYKEDE